MAKLKVPSLQHLSRNWKDNSGSISKDLVRLAKNPPFFNYNRVYSATFDLLHHKQPLNEILFGIKKYEKRETVRNNFLELLPLISDHFEDISPDFVNPVSTRFYSFGKNLPPIPFTPPLVYGVGGQLYFPWFSFWRMNPLKDKNLSLFVTLVSEVLEDDPDFEGIKFEILDFSAASPKDKRFLNVVDTKNIPLLDEIEKIQMLETFTDGFNKAVAVLDSEPKEAPKSEKRESDNYSDDIQPDFFE